MKWNVGGYLKTNEIALVSPCTNEGQSAMRAATGLLSREHCRGGEFQGSSCVSHSRAPGYDSRREPGRLRHVIQNKEKPSVVMRWMPETA